MDNMNIVMTIIFLFTFIPLVIAEIARKKSKTTAGDFFLCERKLSLPLDKKPFSGKRKNT